MIKVMVMDMPILYYCNMKTIIPQNEIRDDSFISNIVAQDYRTSSVFRKYGIDYCCGGRQSLQTACETRGLDVEKVKRELQESLRNINISNSTNFNQWSTDFLADYIVNVHHAFLINNLPDIHDTLNRFVKSHVKKYPELAEILEVFGELLKYLPHLEQEEKIIFPYIKQIAHAYESKEPYAALLVRTLRKPIEGAIFQEREHLSKYIHRLRDLTNHYTPVPNACITHKVAFARLQEMDNDLVQHLHLESNILFPRALAMEREMLALK